jgi:predicted transcriptional regulator
MKTEVFSWRVSPELKSQLEREAGARKVPVSAILDEAARKWLRDAIEEDEEHQRRLHAAASAIIGSVRIGGGPYTNETVRAIIGKKLEKRDGRRTS